jgi:hypothetical protein
MARFSWSEIMAENAILSPVEESNMANVLARLLVGNCMRKPDYEL